MSTKRQQQLGQWLLAAVRNTRTHRALELIREDADLSVTSTNGESALYHALAYQGYALVNPLLEAGANPNAPGPYGTFPIHLAAEYWHDRAPELLETLLAHGAWIGARDDEGCTAMCLAGKSASIETIHTLQHHGADISDRNAVQDTALTFSCCWGMTERAVMLLDSGIDLEAHDDLAMTALHWAGKGGHADTVRVLLDRCARVDIADVWGRTALMRASNFGSLLCVRLLLDAGADPHLRDQDSRSALDCALQYAGRDVTDAMCADSALQSRQTSGMKTEAFVTPDGENAVRASGAGGWSREMCTGFDAIASLLRACGV